MAAAHPYGAFVGCGIKRIGCARRIKVKQYVVFSTITDPMFVEILQSYVRGHSTCLFMNL